MSKFEDDIREQREGIDVESPNLEKLWDAIESDLDKTAVVNHNFRIIKIAAAVLLLFGAGYFTHFIADKNSPSTVELSMADLNPEMAQEELVLQEELEKSFVKLASYNYDEQEMEMFVRELDEIDRIDKELRSSMGKIKDYNRLLHTLLNHYERKIRIINRMIKEIERHEKNENRNEQTVV